METDPDQSEEARLFHEGIHLFNTGEWFEAHETWEDIWRDAGGQRKLFYQGLIQMAVTLEHVRRGNPRGVRSVYATAVPKFKGIVGVYMGIDVPRLLSEMERIIKPVLDLPASYFDPARPQGQALPVDLEKAPRIELEGDPFEGF